MSSYVEGFDCAWPQGKIDWSKVPEKYRFVFCQVANGVTGRDPTGPPDLAGVRASGRFACVYLFFHAESDAEAQVENLWQACGDTMPHAVAIDFETLAAGTTPQQAVDRLRAVATACRARFGGIPLLLYTYPNFDLQVIGKVLALATDLLEFFTLWIADYGKGEFTADKTPVIVPPFTGWSFCQTSGNNSTFIPGINGHVDHDVFHGTEDELRAFFGLPADANPESDRIIHPDIDFAPRDYSGD